MKTVWFKMFFGLVLWIVWIAAGSFFWGLNKPLIDGSEIPTSLKRDFEVYWNVPTYMCHRYGMYFQEVSKEFGILQNSNDQFRGEKIAILYDPGMFPALLKNTSTGELVMRNGGVPQEGNLDIHLKVFKEHVETQIQDPYFQGIAIIDFESWRPIFRQNWGTLSPYRDLSISIVRRRYPFWSQKSVEQEAAQSFEKYGKYFMEETLKLARYLRPRGKWSYYGYPHCFNPMANLPSTRCNPKIPEENNSLSRIFSIQGILAPSVYMSENLTIQEKLGLVNGRIREARRVSKRQKILPYYWYKYSNNKERRYLTADDLTATINEMMKSGSDGVIVWGSSKDLNSREKCVLFRDYFARYLGPALSSTKTIKSENQSPVEEDNAIGLV